MVIKENSYLQLDSFCPNESMFSFSSAEVTNGFNMDNANTTPTQFEALTSPQSVTTRHSPSLDDKSSNGYYSTESPTDTFQRSSSQSSLTSTMSPHDYTELRSPVRQEAHTFFSQGQMFEQTHGFPAQSFGVFETNAVHPVESNGHMMHNELDIKSPLEIKPTMQSGQQFYTHDIIQQGIPGGGQMSSPNSHRGNMAALGIPSISQFSGYRSYQQINEVYASAKPDFYMQPPYFQGYPNYWYVLPN